MSDEPTGDPTDIPPPKPDRKRDAAAKKADKLRLTGAAVTVVLCADTKEAGCASASDMKAAWKHLRKRSKQLARDGVRVAAVPALCVDVCKFGPIAAVCRHDGAAAPAAWYGGCDPDTLDRVLAAHTAGEPDPLDKRLDPPAA